MLFRVSLPRYLTVLLAGPVLLSCRGDGPAGNSRQVPAALQVVSGDAQQDTVGKELAAPVVVRVVDAEGRPVAGQAVNFRVTGGGGSVFAGAAVTGADGIVRERWTLGTSTADAQTLEARAVDNSTGAGLVFGAFTATPLADAPAVMEYVSGNGQRGAPGAELGDSLLVRLLDEYGNPTPGVTVTFTPGTGAGTLSRTTDVTSATGHASTRWTLDPAARGLRSVAAAAGDVATAFEARAVVPPGPPARLVVVSGDEQLGRVGEPLPLHNVVRVEDANGNPVPGVTVRFGHPSFASRLDPPVAVTDDEGLARTRWTLDGGANYRQEMQVTADPLFTPVLFTSVGLPGPAASMAGAFGTSTQQVPAGSTVPTRPGVIVRDRFENRAPGVAVKFSVIGGGGRVTNEIVTTDANGVAQVGSWTLGPVAAENTLAASVGDQVPLVLFSAIGTGTATGRLEIVSGNAQTGPPAATLPLPIVVRALDASGAPVAGVPVTFTIWQNNGWVMAGVTSSQVRVFTDGAGTATVRWGLGGTVGANQLRMTAYGYAQVTATATSVTSR
jgi:hypothetical protein